MNNDQLKIQINNDMKNNGSDQYSDADPFDFDTTSNSPSILSQQQQNIQSSAEQIQRQQTQRQLENSLPKNDYADADTEILLDTDGYVDADLSPKIIDTSNKKNNGQNKCPKCGATDISQNSKTGKLRCNFCRHEFSPETMKEMSSDVYKLNSEFIGSAAQNIQESTNDVVTLKCQSCGAEVVIPTNEASQARCHWCRNYLSINNQLPNGSIPDAILPFSVTKEEAQELINKFVGKRKFYAHPQFKKDFTTENIMGVYFPYYIVDINAHSKMTGIGEHLIRKYTVDHGDNKVTYYDADEYRIERDYDVAIERLTIEASSDKLNLLNNSKTTNIINSIMPFDTENCVHYDPNYLRGYSSERRDTNIDTVRGLARTQGQDIARYKALDTIEFYDRGVCWQNEQFNIKGQRWYTAYLPVWLYSYYQDKGNGQGQLHYVAVNARTKETMGSVPVHYPKLIAIASVIEVFALVIMVPLLALSTSASTDDNGGGWFILLALAGFVYYFVMYGKYRNKDARHFHEKETETKVYNMSYRDDYIQRKTRMRNAQIQNSNCYTVNGAIVNRNLTRVLSEVSRFNDIVS